MCFLRSIYNFLFFSGLSLLSCTLYSQEGPYIFLVIGDGMDDSQIAIAEYYYEERGGLESFARMHDRSSAMIEGYDLGDGLRTYVSDSANTATTLASGVVTRRRMIGRDPNNQDVESLLAIAKSHQLGTAIITTSSLTDATPAAFYAHAYHRDCEGPDYLRYELTETTQPCVNDSIARGGMGSIAEQAILYGPDLLLGGGMEFFDQQSETDPEISLIELAHQNDIDVISNLGTTERAYSRILGIFAEEHLPVTMTSDIYPPADFIRRQEGLNILPEVYSCIDNPQFMETPKLSEMTQYALDYLDQSQGFFMMIESASIDKQAHDRNACGSIGELGQLEETLALILDFASTHEQTYIIVTADHSHAAQVIPDIDSDAAFISPGQIARVRLPNDNLITINYATSDEPESEEHTGSMVPVFGYQIELPAMMKQRDVFPLLKEIIISHP